MSSTGEHFTPNPSNSMTVIQPQPESVQPQTSQPSATAQSALPPMAASSTVFTEVNPSKKRGKVSEVWAHFKRPQDYDPMTPITVKCLYCNAAYTWISSNGTSTLNNHLKTCIKNPLNEAANKKQKRISSYQSVRDGETVSNMIVWKFSQPACRLALARMIIADELPFKFVEHEGFRNFCSIMQPNFKRVTCYDCQRLFGVV